MSLGGDSISFKVVWVKIGGKGELFSASQLGFDGSEWRKVITDREVLSEILSHGVYLGKGSKSSI
jgi:hypothetical protein